jgi:hypothetical protein
MHTERRYLREVSEVLCTIILMKQFRIAISYQPEISLIAMRDEGQEAEYVCTFIMLHKQSALVHVNLNTGRITKWYILPCSTNVAVKGLVQQKLPDSSVYVPEVCCTVILPIMCTHIGV